VKLTFRQSFARDLKKIKDITMLDRIKQMIERIEAAKNVSQIEGLTKLSGTTSSYYRIRIGDYRLGILLRGNELEFVRCLHRREIYRYFP
jgi:mRNA interferase RelE/StbE